MKVPATLNKIKANRTLIILVFWIISLASYSDFKTPESTKLVIQSIRKVLKMIRINLMIITPIKETGINILFLEASIICFVSMITFWATLDFTKFSSSLSFCLWSFFKSGSLTIIKKTNANNETAMATKVKADLYSKLAVKGNKTANVIKSPTTNPNTSSAVALPLDGFLT